MSSSWRMHISWLVLALGGLWGISIARAGQAAGQNTSVVATALLYGYFTWSLYWGGPSFLAWWRSTFLRFAGLAGCGFQLGLAIAALFLAGIPFCTLGGGIYQFSRHWRAARYHA